ncbi:MAG: CAP domain-containing protein [Leptolyngbyaceae cyanobacterium SM1_3_5]|nr:CAP domain-containing protein [Leptolyngbyaceae cyanobacterium SM1_3_5]
MADQILSLVNDFRSRNGLNAVRLSDRLTAAAQGHSQNMASQDFYSHISKDGTPFDQRIRAAGYRFSTAAENIAAGFATADSVFNGWSNSPGHRANMLNPNMQEIGVGHVFLSNDLGVEQWNHYWTLKLAAPQ